MVACEQTLRGALAAGRENERELTTTYLEFQSGFKHECLDAKRLNFVRVLDKCGHTAHYKELTATGNRASKLSGIQVSDCLTA